MNNYPVKSSQLALLENGRRLDSGAAKTIQRLERKLRLIAKERDSYRSVLDSYENDVTINPVSMQSKRIATLESFVEEYRKLTTELEADGCNRAKQTVTVEVRFPSKLYPSQTSAWLSSLVTSSCHCRSRRSPQVERTKTTVSD